MEMCHQQGNKESDDDSTDKTETLELDDTLPISMDATLPVSLDEDFGGKGHYSAGHCSALVEQELGFEHKIFYHNF